TLIRRQQRADGGMLWIIRGTDHAGRLVQHQISLAGQAHELAVQAHGFASQQVAGFWPGDAVDGHGAAADELFHLFAAEAGDVGEKIIKAHGGHYSERSSETTTARPSGKNSNSAPSRFRATMPQNRRWKEALRDLCRSSFC